MKHVILSFKCTLLIILFTSSHFHLNAQTTRLWSMTSLGGENDAGTIISYNPANGDELVQYSFSTSGDGYDPYGSLVNFGGKLYGLTNFSNSGSGSIFSFDPSTGKDSVLYTFSADGISPTGSLVVYNSKLYGMTSSGGLNNSGVIFSYAPSSNTYAKLYDFDPNYAGSPHGSLIVYNNLLWGLALSSYVTAGHNGCIFSFDPSTNAFADKHDFPGPYPYTLGENPYGDLTVLNNVLYGTAGYGGAHGFGVLFSYVPSTNAYTDLHDFNVTSTSLFYNGNGPTGNVVVYNNKLYGLSNVGGLNPDLNSSSPGCGFIFSYDPSSSTFSELYDFDGTNGRNPRGSLFLYNSKFYGMTTASGNSFFDGPGVIFSFDPSSSSFTNLVNFNGANGKSPQYSSFISFSSSNTQTISTGSITGTYCSGSGVSISYTASGTFTNGNIFIAQLSDSAGHFSNAVNIGSTTSISSGTISATIPVNAFTSTHYRIRVISSKPAVAGSDNGTNITINQTPTPVITPSGSITVCSGNPITLQANSVAGYTYQWKIGGSSINGATASSYNTGTAGSYTVVETFATCSATSSTAAVVTVDSYMPTITPSGTVNICNSSSLQLQTTKVAGYTYQWKKNGTSISGATTFKYTATAAGSYTIQVNDGNCSPTSAATVITMSAPPTATITPSGNVTVCTGNSILLQANSGIGLTYQWKKSGNNINGATTSGYTASMAAPYTVVVSLGQCSSASAATTLSVDAGPTATVTPSGTVTVCPAVSVTLTANNGVGLIYQWLKSGVAIAGATGKMYSTSVTGSYSVNETNTNGCSATSAKTTTKNFTVTVKITNTGSLHICSSGSVTLNAQILGGYTYQWYNSSSPINGATGTSYVATAAGVYKYLATTSDGCTKFSSTKTVTGCKLEEENATSDASLMVFPNPAHEEATIVLSSDDGNYKIEVMNIEGQILLVREVTIESGNNNFRFDVSMLPSGMYLVRATSATSQYTCRLSKE